MKHYFKEQDVYQEFKIKDTIASYNLILTSSDGVFSAKHIDLHTKLLVEKIIETNQSFDSILDIGCGYGVVGIVMAKHYNCKVEMIDINPQAVYLSKINVELNNVKCAVYESDLFSNVKNKFDCIISNPPIHAGKDLCHMLYTQALEYLNSNGRLYIVLHKKHGAKSTLEYLNNISENVDVIYKKKSVYIIEVKK